MPLTISSPAFAQNDSIPAEHTCDGANVPPPIEWEGTPKNAASLVLIVDDPDAPDPEAPKRTFVHWVLYDIPPTATEIHSHSVSGARVGPNDAGGQGYSGPCPPVGRHRYFFKLYALDVKLGDLGQATKASVEAAMAGHVIAKAQLIGTYQRSKAAAASR
jgi:Raf kinase inhibitor-like YbhB/YbcL family protein